MAKLDELVRKHALLNAVEHNGKASPGAVLGRVLAEQPGLKNKVRDVMKTVTKAVASVNSISLEEQKAEISKLGVKKKAAKKRAGLPAIKAVKGKVVMRFAPNPNGPMSLGHSRQALNNWWYVKKYKGRYVLRFDDTDPKIKTPLKKAYGWFLEDLKWLGIKPDRVVKASNRFGIYYDHALRLVRMGKAYVCTCSAEEFSRLKTAGKPCPDRGLGVKEQEARWKNMFSKYKEARAVLRIKTDLNHKNPAMRDWPAFRIVDKPIHPFLRKTRVWPLYDFASAVDDHLLGITHAIRGVDFLMTQEKQGFLYKYFGWKYPANIVTGKLLVEGVKSTSEARRLIEAGKIKGWDDPRLGTLMAFRRRGFTPEAVIRFVEEAGFTRGDVKVSQKSLAAFNKDIIDDKTDRYFFVADPVTVEVRNPARKEAELPIHPDHPHRGKRKLKIKKKIVVSKDDSKLLKKDSQFRLKDLFNVKAAGKRKVDCTGVGLTGLPIIHWLPTEQGVKASVLMPDGSAKKGLVEKAAASLKLGTRVQFERFGFCRLDRKKPLTFVFGHR